MMREPVDPEYLTVMQAVIQHPWQTLTVLVGFSGLPRDLVREALAWLDAREHLRYVRVFTGWYGTSRTRFYAPTDYGVAWCASVQDKSPEAFCAEHGLTNDLFWQQRLCRPIERDIGLFVGRLRAHRPEVHLEVATFQQRTLKGHPLWLHAQLRVSAPAGVRTFDLLIDHGADAVWMWWRHLTYFQTNSRRGRPPLLVLTTREHRATALLALARHLCPRVPVMVSADRAEVLAGDPGAAVWRTNTSTGAPVEVRPFEPNPAWLPVETRPRALAARRSRGKAAMLGLDQLPARLALLPAWEELTATERATLTFLSRHPVCTVPQLAALLDQPEQDIATNTTLLESKDLAARTARDGGALVSATATAVWLLAETRGSATAERACERFEQARLDHLRRLQHSLDVVDIFARLHQHAKAWSRVMRRMDAPTNGVNAGVIPHVELEVFDEDLHAAEHFAVAGVPRKWLPDAYGVLRFGEEWHPFWLELDGTQTTRSRIDPQVWQRKLDNLCAFVATGKWRLRHATQPKLLIVTQDLRNHPLICDALGIAARGCDIAPPAAYVASLSELVQRGPLASIWLTAHAPIEAGFGHAFPALLQRRERC